MAEDFCLPSRAFYLSQAIKSLSRSLFALALYSASDTNGLYFVLPPLFFTEADFATPPGYTLFNSLQFANFTIFGPAASTSVTLKEKLSAMASVNSNAATFSYHHPPIES